LSARHQTNWIFSFAVQESSHESRGHRRAVGGAAALKAGLDVHVYEQAPRITEVGAGIQISPNASRLLHRLGLGPAMDAVGVRPRALHQRRWDDGQLP
jgi:2-polyprenyl-6-methoxyphenol hydroxylase-like FAD-dependent oxidoreductase